jgi:hypothetical protein
MARLVALTSIYFGLSIVLPICFFYVDLNLSFIQGDAGIGEQYTNVKFGCKLGWEINFPGF